MGARRAQCLSTQPSGRPPVTEAVKPPGQRRRGPAWSPRPPTGQRCATPDSRHANDWGRFARGLAPPTLRHWVWALGVGREPTQRITDD
eukprot:358637-Chlamydomonas_euryale.AAC.4